MSDVILEPTDLPISDLPAPPPPEQEALWADREAGPTEVDLSPAEQEDVIGWGAGAVLAALGRSRGLPKPPPEMLDRMAPAIRRIILRHWPDLMHSGDMMDALIVAVAIGEWAGSAPAPAHDRAPEAAPKTGDEQPGDALAAIRKLD